MTRPTLSQIALARSTLPVQRVASTAFAPQTQGAQQPFASVLKTAGNTRTRPTTTDPRIARLPLVPGTGTFMAPMQPAAAQPAHEDLVADGPPIMTRAQIVDNAKQYMGIPYVWGANSSAGLDCSAFISKAWGISRHTTDNLSAVAVPISKEELQSGDALNLTTARDADGAGHVRLFDRWANPEHTRMYVYEETPPKSVYHAINWDPTYTPMRRKNVTNA